MNCDLCLFGETCGNRKFFNGMVFLCMSYKSELLYQIKLRDKETEEKEQNK